MTDTGITVANTTDQEMPVTKTLPLSTDVLIIGAGPTGLMLANQLGRRGIRAAIIDRHSGPAQQTRAMAVHARTLEIYKHLGVADRAIDLGLPGTGANMWSGGKLRAHIPFTGMGEGQSAFPYVLMLGQDDNEKILGEHLRHWKMDVLWNHELVALEQAPDHVTATIKTLMANQQLSRRRTWWDAMADAARCAN